MPRIRVAHSPDSDDAFMFYALAAGKIDTEGREYEHELADIETLNQRAYAGELEVTAVSFHAYAYLHERYALLPHGASIGDKYGPRLVAREPPPEADVDGALAGLVVAIPGERTTATLVLRLYQPDIETVVVPFDRVEDYVLNGHADVGLLIHEGQLTYAERGLHLWQDLGEWWGKETGLPLPLGGNVARKDLGPELIRAVSGDLRASIVWGLEHRAEALAHAQQYARGMDAARTDRFVGMYVNDYTVDYGPRGREAVQRLLHEGWRAGHLPSDVRPEFIED
ncbi:MAG: ABC transporter substrate-binding protein [Gemmatimonadetes bacterium GWC2_71_9]|nr:MAG: ABC transporter substrate-binding protein [Gemmatimonadetes bacterium GWC2_71_9]